MGVGRGSGVGNGNRALRGTPLPRAPKPVKDSSMNLSSTRAHAWSRKLTDVRGNQQTLPTSPWTKVTHQVRLASSRYSLRLWNEAKVHASSEWPCWGQSVAVGWWARTGVESTEGLTLWDLVVFQPSPVLPLWWFDPQDGKKNVLHRRLSLCNFTVSVLFSISEQVKWRKDIGDLFKYKD